MARRTSLSFFLDKDLMDKEVDIQPQEGALPLEPAPKKNEPEGEK